MSSHRGSAAALMTIAALAALTGGCSIISFDRLTVTVWPRDRNAILPTGAAPWVEFPDSVDRPAVQRLFTLSSPGGSATGDFRWEGRRMYFDAAPPLRAGVRYVLQFRGRVALENGETFDASEEVPFYVGHEEAGPALISIDPVDGATAGVQTPLVLGFSAPLDPLSFHREFNLQPSMETEVTWDTACRTVTIAAKDGWTNLTTYTWTIGKDVAAPDGSSMGIEQSGRFRVQLDATAPSVVSVVPAVRMTLTPTGSDLDHTGAEDALLITFSEDVRTDTLSAAFTLNPPTTGTVARVAPGVFAFVPTSNLVMEQAYVLRIGPTVEDSSGNKLTSAYEASFTPFIPVQRVLTVAAVYPGSTDTWNVFNTLDARPISVDVDGNVTLVITFQEPFTAEARARVLSRILFDGYFPMSLADPSLVSASWSSGLELTLIYTDLHRSDPGMANYYKLTLPGGAASSDNGFGSFLKEDVWLYFLASL